MKPETPGDEPDAAELFADPTNPRAREAISALADAGLLTDKQAEAWVRRGIDLEPRDAVAEDMGIAPSTLDDHRGAAKERIAAARETIAILDLYRSPALPETCDECGGSLGGRWVTTDDGAVWCSDCADVEVDV